VFGQALALRGPVGSMIRSINTMKPYQLFVVGLFTTNIFFLVMSTLFQAAIYMTPLCAAISTGLTFLGINTIRTFLLDIYNEFNFPGMFRNAFDVDEDSWKKDRSSSTASFDGGFGHRMASTDSRVSDRSFGMSFEHIVGDEVQMPIRRWKLW